MEEERHTFSGGQWQGMGKTVKFEILRSETVSAKIYFFVKCYSFGISVNPRTQVEWVVI